jgi:glycosyltransferase involved in cell wall biosynthesis
MKRDRVPVSSLDASRAPRVGLVLEQTLGHITHADNLRSIIPGIGGIRPVWCPVYFEATRFPARFVKNWTVRAGLRGRRAIRQAHGAVGLDALFIHTQVPAVLAQDWMRRIPTVVSLDATPRQYDSLGAHYGHEVGSGRVENWKSRANKRCYARAAHLVTWSHWAKAGLVDEYDVPAAKISVIPPGVRVRDWRRPEAVPARDGSVVRILFVGGNLERKGGLVLLDAFRKLRAERDGAWPEIELHLVTQSPLAAEDGVFVHHGLTPNSDELRALYHRSDVFCLPTRGDCLPMVLAEAGAAGLPLVSTAVGAIPEVVRDGETGTVVPVDDAEVLVAALQPLLLQPALRARLGAGAAALVSREHDAEANAARLVGLLREVAAVPR